MEEASGSQFMGDVEEPPEPEQPLPETAAAQELANIFAEPSSDQPDGSLEHSFKCVELFRMEWLNKENTLLWDISSISLCITFSFFNRLIDFFILIG